MMSYTQKLHAGSVFPQLIAKNSGDDEHDLGARNTPETWKMVVVYRGRHCPMCTKYLNKLQLYRDRLKENNVEVVAVSGDSKEQLEEHKGRLEVDFPLYWGLTIEQMKSLGLYISHPRSPQETDHPFPEPGLFVVNSEGRLQVVDISNNPFVRPDIEVLTSGLEWIRNPENNYPIRGTFE